jgi:hypothetical protein
MSPNTNTPIGLSEIESKILGLNIGRYNCNDLDDNFLYDQIAQNKLDLCRIKLPAEYDTAPYHLFNMGLPVFFSGSIQKYRTRITEHSEVSYQFSNLDFEMYDGSQDLLLKDMLIDTWGNYPLCYYRSPFLSSLITKEQEIECVYQYYKKYNLNRDYPDNKLFFMKHGDNYVGIFALNVVGNTLECNLAGIHSSYRSAGYFHDEMNFKKEYCVKNKLEYFTFGARNENASVQRVFQHLNFQTAGNENVFHVVPLLNYTQIEGVTFILKTIGLSHAQASRLLQDTVLELATAHFPELNFYSFQMNRAAFLFTKKEFLIRVSFPIVTNIDALIVIQTVENDNKFCGYLRLKSK